MWSRLSLKICVSVKGLVGYRRFLQRRQAALEKSNCVCQYSINDLSTLDGWIHLWGWNINLHVAETLPKCTELKFVICSCYWHFSSINTDWKHSEQPERRTINLNILISVMLLSLSHRVASLPWESASGSHILLVCYFVTCIVLKWCSKWQTWLFHRVYPVHHVSRGLLLLNKCDHVDLHLLDIVEFGLRQWRDPVLSQWQ